MRRFHRTRRYFFDLSPARNRNRRPRTMKNVTLGRAGFGAGADELKAPSKRRFLNFLLGTGAFATMGAILYPVFKFMVPPQLIEAAQNSVVAAKVSRSEEHTSELQS